MKHRSCSALSNSSHVMNSSSSSSLPTPTSSSNQSEQLLHLETSSTLQILRLDPLSPWFTFHTNDSSRYHHVTTHYLTPNHILPSIHNSTTQSPTIKHPHHDGLLSSNSLHQVPLPPRRTPTQDLPHNQQLHPTHPRHLDGLQEIRGRQYNLLRPILHQRALLPSTTTRPPIRIPRRPRRMPQMLLPRIPLRHDDIP